MSIYALAIGLVVVFYVIYRFKKTRLETTRGRILYSWQHSPFIISYLQYTEVIILPSERKC